MPTTTPGLWWNVILLDSADAGGANTKMFFAHSATTNVLYFRLKYGSTWGTWATVNTSMYSPMTLATGTASSPSATATVVSPAVLQQVIRTYVTGTSSGVPTSVGQAVMTAVSQQQAREAIGAGTSNLVLGTTSSTAKAGDYTPTIAGVTGLQGALDGKASAVHDHHGDYYTKVQADGQYVSTSGSSTKAGNLYMDGGEVAYIRPDTTGGWSRGFSWQDRDYTEIAGIGLFGNADVVSYFFLGLGDEPWYQPVFRAYQDLIRITNLDVTGAVTGIEAADVGARPAGDVPWSDISGKPTAYPPETHTHTATQISDATTTGRNVLKATDAAAARSAIGAGTSNLALGTTASTAKAGNYQPTISGVTGLQSALDGKANTSHTHTISQITDMLPISTSYSHENSIPYRTTGGAIAVPTASITASANVTNKEYVDTRVPQSYVVSSLPSQLDASALYFILE